MKVGRKRMRRKGVQVEKERGGVGLKRELTLPPQHHRINHPSPLPGDDHDHDPNPDDPDPDHHHHEWETVASAGTHESHQIMLTDEPTALQCRHHRHRQCHLHQQCNFIAIPISYWQEEDMLELIYMKNCSFSFYSSPIIITITNSAIPSFVCVLQAKGQNCVTALCTFPFSTNFYILTLYCQIFHSFSLTFISTF